MKTLNTFALGVIICISSAFSQATASNMNNPGQPANYVVIGAFSVYKNAVNFSSQASKLNLDAKYEMNRNRNLYYVYVLNTDNRQQAIEEALRLRKESPYNDTWVFQGDLSQLTSAIKGTDINPATAEPIDKVDSSDTAAQTETTSNTGQASVSPEVTAGTSAAVQNQSIPADAKNEEGPQKKGIENPDSGVEGKGFYFKIFRADDKNQVEGDVNVIDAERSRKMGTYAGNTQVKISAPGGREGKISLVCEVFGYRKIQRDLNYQTPEGEDIQSDENHATVVPFELVRLQKGDIAVMYNVFFFKDAAVMRPESRYEVTSLLNMLQENPKYKIKIHGHTNGGAHGKIISMNKDSDSFFALNNTKDGIGSAKELSEERAEVIRKFLLSSGVDEKRMIVKAWGGKRAIYDKHSPQAQSNVRVEIEILEN